MRMVCTTPFTSLNVSVTHARRLLRWRRRVQAARSVPDGRVLALFVGGMDTDLLDTDVPGWVNAALERYRRLVLRLLGWPERDAARVCRTGRR